MPKLRDLTDEQRRSLSPYLLDHIDNPVDWWTWSDDAFEHARERDVPVFLSVGYASCHWCHVMARESFADPATAELLNHHFVSIKVDREERPDVDAVYMAATQGLTGQGGWPMSVFLDHERKPFYAGTYFPPVPRHGLPSFGQLLAGIAQAWQARRGELAAAADRVVSAVAARQSTPDLPEIGELRPRLVGASNAAAESLAADFDVENGGFGGAPKFPPTAVLEFLLRRAVRVGDSGSLAMVERTCEAMARGGIYDQLAGGFARYSVDERWQVPHFEKMLYDNAQLLRLYAHVTAVTGSPLARRVCEETSDFLLREMRTTDGGFASSLDADAARSDGSGVHEGASYVWTYEQILDVLGEADGARAAALLTVTPRGNFELGTSVLQLPVDPTTSKALAGVSDPHGWWQRVRTELFESRARRPQPALDDKVITGWNGLVISAMVDAGRVLSCEDLLEAARGAAEFVTACHLTADGRLARSSRNGMRSDASGVLADYALLADGLLSVYSHTGDGQWLAHAGELLASVVDHFYSESDGFSDVAADATGLIARPADPFENETPSGWAAATNALMNYATLTARSDLLAIAEHGLRLFASGGGELARFTGSLAASAEAYLDGPVEVVAVIGPEAGSNELLNEALASVRPGGLVLVGQAGMATGQPFEQRPLLHGRSAAYVCRGMHCYPPVVSPADLVELLNPGE